MSSGYYHIVAKGQLGDRFADAFDDMTQAPQGRDTVLEGRFADQSQLNGLFDHLRRLGIEIRSFDTQHRSPQTRRTHHD